MTDRDDGQVHAMDLKTGKIVMLHRGGTHVDADQPDQTDRFKRVVMRNVSYLATRVREGSTGVLVDEGMKTGAAILADWKPQDESEEPACFVDAVRKVLSDMGSNLGVQVVWVDKRRPGSEVIGKEWQVNLVRPDGYTNGRVDQ